MNVNNNYNFQLSVQNQDINPPPEINIDVSQIANHDQHPEIDVQRTHLIPPDEIRTDLPDSNVPEGNTMKCIQDMLFEAVGLDSANMSEADRLKNFKKLEENNVVQRVKGKYLKNGELADSPPVADVHHDPITGDNYFKYLVTWEIDAIINGNPVTLQKTQWVVTGVEIPRRFDSPKYVRQRFHFAFLALKLHITTHKAAVDPNNNHHQYVNRCIKDLMRTNLCGFEGYIKENRLGFSGELYSSGIAKFKPTTVLAGQTANTIAVVLFDDSGEKMVLFQNQSDQGRKLSADERKSELATGKEGAERLSDKRFRRALDTELRYGEFAKHQKIMGADPNEILQLIKDSRVDGKNSRGLEPHERASELYNSILSQHSTMDRNAKLKQQELLRQALQIYFPYRPNLGNALKGLGYRTGLVNINYNNVKGCLDDLKFSELTAKEKNLIKKLIKKYEEKVEILRTNEERVNRIKLHYFEESLADESYLSDSSREIKENWISQLSEQIENGEVPKSMKLRKQEKTLERFEKWVSDSEQSDISLSVKS